MRVTTLRARAAIATVALLASGAASAHAAAPRTISLSVGVAAHRSSGALCSSGGRYCADVGCPVAAAAPVTSDEVSSVPFTQCAVQTTLTLSGVVTDRGRPVAHAYVLLRGTNTDSAFCWGDQSVSAITACSGKRQTRSAHGGPVYTDAKGRFSKELDADSYAAAGPGMPLPQLRTCRDIPFRASASFGPASAPASGTSRACA